MQNRLGRVPLALKALRELGPERAFWYAVYQAGLRSGIIRRATPIAGNAPLEAPVQSPFVVPGQQRLRTVLGPDSRSLLEEADAVTNGMTRLFGGPPSPLALAAPDPSQHWTYYEGRPSTWGTEDIKLVWEPARFGWTYPLGRAYALNGDEKYPAAFWQYFETFLQANPPNQGPDWMSAQEVALRLLALLFAARAFALSPCSTPERMGYLAGALAAHARRIPATLSYARAQNNNHRISEALGLYAAGCALPGYPGAERWRRLGWSELNAALRSQIHPDGTYAQHSASYHRLMLALALQGGLFGQQYPPETIDRLGAATRWLLAQVDPASGRAPNLGSNDGANVLPLSGCEFYDFRPVAQAAARAFLGQASFPLGPWDELGLWLNQVIPGDEAGSAFPGSPAVLRLEGQDTWATLRAVRFGERPSHADQLHVELWWRGENIALDAGTYRYTAASPWDNSLARTCVHNTIEVNGQDQMRRAGRFLWLDWAQADLLDAGGLGVPVLAAQHNGYARLGVTHRRLLKLPAPHRWQVIDYLLRGQATRMGPARDPLYLYRLQWLLPDWLWELEGTALRLKRPGGGTIRLAVTTEQPVGTGFQPIDVSLVRAGQTLVGTGQALPIMGWYSPTYNVKEPALSFSVTVRSPLPFSILSDWTLAADAEGVN